MIGIYISFFKSFLGILAPSGSEKKEGEVRREVQPSELVTNRNSLKEHFLREIGITYQNRDPIYKIVNYEINFKPILN